MEEAFLRAADAASALLTEDVERVMNQYYAQVRQASFSDGSFGCRIKREGTDYKWKGRGL